MKKCTKCGVTKSIDKFHKSSRNKDGHISQCKSCKNAIIGSWQSNNKDRLQAADRRYKQKNKEKVKDRLEGWRKANQDHVLAYNATRRAAKRQAVPFWSEKEKIKTVYKKARELGMSVDHVVPLDGKIVCGLHVWANLQVLECGLNAGKKNYYWPDMWEEELYGSEAT